MCTDVESEPFLLPVTKEALLGRSANISAEEHLDFAVFWRRGRNALFNVRVPNPDSASQVNFSIPSIFRKHEEVKKREYNDSVMQVELDIFTPLVFTITGSMDPDCLQFHKLLAEKLASKSDERYSDVINYTM